MIHRRIYRNGQAGLDPLAQEYSSTRNSASVTDHQKDKQTNKQNKQTNKQTGCFEHSHSSEVISCTENPQITHC